MLKAFLGWDQRDALAYEVCRRSLVVNASIPLEVRALKHWELRQQKLYRRPYWCDEDGQMWDGVDERPFSTSFAFTRFLVPALAEYRPGLVLFCDADMLWRADVAELVALAERQPDKAVLCVQHDHQPAETIKMGGLLQTRYLRKNWSSLMLFRPDRCRALTPYVVNHLTGGELHAMTWIDDEEIGALPVAWNWLEGSSDPAIDPKVVHLTRGTPDLVPGVDLAYADEWRSWLGD